jgi:hypothetical protein
MVIRAKWKLNEVTVKILDLNQGQYQATNTGLKSKSETKSGIYDKTQLICFHF